MGVGLLTLYGEEVSLALLLLSHLFFFFEHSRHPEACTHPVGTVRGAVSMCGADTTCHLVHVAGVEGGLLPGPVPVLSSWLTCDGGLQLYLLWTPNGHSMDSANVPCQDTTARGAQVCCARVPPDTPPPPPPVA